MWNRARRGAALCGLAWSALVFAGGCGGGDAPEPAKTSATVQGIGKVVASQPVGTLPGELQVTGDGGAIYEIPLWVPPGRAGIEPTLGVRYSSRGGNGLLGMGWTLTGLSAIEPCNHTWAIDGNQAGAVELKTPSDAYCLDGTRLVPTGATGPGENAETACTEYRTIPDRFARVVHCTAGNVGAVPNTWYVRSRDGRIMQYGTGAGRIAPAAQNPVAWLIEKTADRNGNAMTFSYKTSGGTPGNPACTSQCLEFRPDHIDYTSASGLTATRSVIFEYDPLARPDKLRRYLHGFTIDTNDRLKRIRAVADGVTLRTYDFTYLPSPTSRRTRLTKLQTCDHEVEAGGVCQPATTFAYSTDVTGTQPWGALPQIHGTLPGYHPTDPLYLTDVNGDGLDDLLYWRASILATDTTPTIPGAWVVKLSTGSGFGPPQDQPIPVDPAGAPPLGSTVYDVNADGTTDLITTDCEPGNCFRPRAFVWDHNAGHFVLGSFPNLAPPWTSQVNVIDALGDGNPSWIARGNGADGTPLWQVVQNRFNPNQIQNAAWTDLTRNFFRDLDGDGKQEFMRYLPDGSNTSINALTVDGFDAQGNAVTRTRAVATGPSAEAMMNAHCLLWADVNGDRQLDAIDPVGGQMFFNLGMLGVNFGGFHQTDWWSTTQGPLPLCNDADPAATGYRIADYNGDGLLDLLVLGKANSPAQSAPAEFARVFITRPDGSGADPLQLPIQLVNPDLPLPPPPLPEDPPPPPPPPWVGAKNTRLFDLNGDGHFDLFQMDGQQSFVVDRQNALPVDLLVSVTNGLGRRDSVAYATLADIPSQYTRCFTAGCFNGPFTVVTTQTVDDGAAGTQLTHNYYDARVDRKGLGFLGFGAHDVIDTRNGAVTRTVYDNTLLVAGAPPGTAWYGNLDLPTQILTYVNDSGTWRASRTKTSLVSVLTANNTSFFTFPLLSEIKSYEGTSFTVVPPGQPDPQFDCPGSQPRCAGLTSSATHVIVEDNLGNIATDSTTRYVMTSGSNVQYVDTVSYAYDAPANDLAKWLLGRPTLRTQTSTVTGFASEPARTTRYNYDSNGNLIQIEREPGSVNGATTSCSATSADPEYHRTKLTRDTATGMVTKVIESPSAADGDVRERSITFGLDAQKLVPTSAARATGNASVPNLATLSIVHTGLGVTTETIDENGVVSDFDFDGFGRPRAARHGDGLTRSLSYQAGTAPYALVVSTTGNDGSATAVYFDRLDRPLRTTRTAFSGATSFVDTTYDAFGRVHDVTRPYFAGASPIYYAARYTYDAIGRVTVHSRHDSTTTQTIATHYQYSGLTTDAFDEQPNRHRRISDGAGHIVDTQTFPDGIGLHTRLSYGPFDTLRTVTDPAGNVVTMAYDSLGRQTDITDADTGHIHVAYNEFDEPVTRTDAIGQTECTITDRVGRPISRTAPDGTDLWVWDTAPGGLGRLGQSTRTAPAPAPTVSTSYQYDQHGIVNERWTIDGTQYDLSYDYDQFGRPTTISYPAVPGITGRFQVVRKYNAFGYENQLVDETTTTHKVLWMASTADAENHVTSETLGNGLAINSEFFSDTGELKHRTTPGVYDMEYAYFLNGNLLSRTDHMNSAFPGATKVDTETFTYDTANRLTQVTLSRVNGPTRVTTYGYDTLGNLTHAGDDAACSSYVYGGAGAGPHQLTQATCFGTAFNHSYDKNGNEVETVAPDFREQTWTSFGKLDEMRTRNGRMKYGYDANHHRVFKTKVPGTISWMTDPPPASPPLDSLSGVWDTTHYVGELYEKRSGTGLATIDHVFHLSVAGRRLGQMTWHEVPGANTGTQEYSYDHLDYQGTVERTTDASGSVREFSSSTAWGARRAVDWENSGVNTPQNTRTGYTGHPYDDEFGTVDMDGRIYDPYFKRFLSPDPKVQAPLFGPSWNRYSYAWNNPLRMTDPTGLSAECPTCSDWTGLNPLGVLGGLAWVGRNTVGFLANASKEVGNIITDLPGALECVLTLGFACGGGRSAVSPGSAGANGPNSDGRAADFVARVCPIAGSWGPPRLEIDEKALQDALHKRMIYEQMYNAGTPLIGDPARPPTGAREFYREADRARAHDAAIVRGVEAISNGGAATVAAATAMDLLHIEKERQVAVLEIASNFDQIGTAVFARESDHDRTTRTLRAHADAAFDRLRNQGFSDRMAWANAANPRLLRANTGTMIDKLAKHTMVLDPALDHVLITPQGRFGPDVFQLSTGTWWDMTTAKSWNNHTRKYNAQFGVGTSLLY